MQTLAELILHIGLVLLLAPLPGGLIRKIKAFSQKRQGPPLLQEYRDLRKLFPQRRGPFGAGILGFFRRPPSWCSVRRWRRRRWCPCCPGPEAQSFREMCFWSFPCLALGRFFLALGGWTPEAPSAAWAQAER